jgi:hypothetical protein
MHVGFGPVRINQTTGGGVAYLHPQRATHFFTAAAAPCTALFKPVWLDAGLPDTGPQPTGQADAQSLFWQHERLHRLTLEDYPTRSAVYCANRDALEERWTAEALALAGAPPAERLAFSQHVFDEAAQAEAGWLAQVRATPIRRPAGKLYQLAWNGFNRQANLTL